MSDARLALSLWLAAFLTRYVLYLGTPIFGADGAEYLLMADWMREGRWAEALSITYHPLYPMLVSAFRGIAGDTERAGFWVSMLLGSAATVPLFLVVQRLFDRPVAVITALLYAVQPHTVEVQADTMTEGTFCFFFFASMALIRRSMDEPSLEGSVAAGLSAAAAYLTKPEGILVVVLSLAWPAWGLLRRKEGRAARMRHLALGAVVMLLLAFPYLLWVRSVMGTWKLSAKPSVTSTEAGVRSAEFEEGSAATPGKMGKAMLKSSYFVTLPFMALGLAGLRGRRAGELLYFFSFPLGYLAGLFYALRALPGFSNRYILLPMNLLMVLAGLGFVVARRRFAQPWAAPLLASLLLLPMAVTALRPHRVEEESIREAAEWIRGQGVPAGSVYSTTDKIGYFLHGLPLPFPVRVDEFRRGIASRPGKLYVVVEKESGSSASACMDWLIAAGGVGEPKVFARPHATERVKVYPAR